MGKAQVEAGLHTAVGGRDKAINPGEILLYAFIACFGVTLQAVATYMGLVIRNGTVNAEGELELWGTLGVAEGVQVGFQRVGITLELDTDASEEELRH